MAKSKIMYVNEKMMGTEATLADIWRMVNLLQMRGFNVQYSKYFEGGNYVPSDIWNDCLNQIAIERQRNV